jgi:DNA-binding NtrC family response regulator
MNCPAGQGEFMENTMYAQVQFMDSSQKTVKVEEFTLIGNDPTCHIQMAPPAAERHARIEKKEDGYLIRDLRSPSGTYVNGQRIQEAFLNASDIIRICEQDMVFSLENGLAEETFPMKSRNPEWNDELKSLIHVSKTDFPVLLLGPSGTGKDIIAQAMHEKSSRKNGPFLSVNCSALTETLVESELFGHVKGSFTGAISDRKGAFEAARGGTLFLDEIGDLPYGLQAKILRALENNEIRPVGSDRTTTTDVRIIAATHQNLSEKINEGVFRSDLYFRLNVVAVHPPALAARMEDFDELLYTFARQMRVRFSVAAINKLKMHSWPGNIRELKNLVARASAYFPKQYIEESHIDRLIDKVPLSTGIDASDSLTQMPVIKEIEKQMIIKRLIANRGNQRRTAQDLGMPKSTLHDRLKYYEIDILQFKV